MINLASTYQEKYSVFECGFHSFIQTRVPFSIPFFIYALLYLLLDLEILLIFPFAVSGYANNIYGLIIVLIFTSIITLGFIYELGKGALKINSRQGSNVNGFKSNVTISFLGRIDSNSFNNSPPFRGGVSRKV